MEFFRQAGKKLTPKDKEELAESFKRVGKPFEIKTWLLRDKKSFINFTLRIETQYMFVELILQTCI